MKPKGPDVAALIITAFCIWVIIILIGLAVFIKAVDYAVDRWTETPTPDPVTLVTPISIPYTPQPTPPVTMFVAIPTPRPTPFWGETPCRPWGMLSKRGCQPLCEAYHGCMGLTAGRP